MAQFTVPRRQRGTIGLMAAVTLGAALLFMLLAVDSGRLYLEQRKLQRVADMSALAAANQNAVCTGAGTSALTVATATALLNNHPVGTDRTLAAACGNLVTGANSVRAFSANAASNQAIQVSVTHNVATSVAAGLWSMANGNFSTTTNLQAKAVAALPGPPLAQLNIRSTLVSVDTAKSSILNPLFSGLLGGNVNLTAAGWDGLVKTDINLLAYLNQLAINLHVTAGDYTQLLNTNVSVTQLIQATIDVLQANGAAATITNSLGSLQLASANTGLVTLGDLLKLQSGTTSAGLNASMQVFELIQAFAQLANSQSAATATLPINVLGLASVTTRLKVIEPPQYSAIGDPSLAVLNPTGPNKIYVRTAQVRVLVAVKLPNLNAVSGVTSAVSGLAGTLTGVLTSVLTLNIPSILNALTCAISCQQLDLQILPTPEIDISLDIASAESYLTAYSCSTSKSLTARTLASAATLKLGHIESASTVDLSSPLTVTPLALIDIGTCQKLLLGLLPCMGARKSFVGGGLGLMVNVPVLGQTQDLLFSGTSAPPNINLPSSYKTLGNGAIVQSLKNALAGVSIQAYAPSNDNILGGLISTAASVLGGLNSLLAATISNVLSPLLDPILSNLLSSLGIDLNQVEVGANLTCQTGRAALVI